MYTRIKLKVCILIGLVYKHTSTRTHEHKVQKAYLKESNLHTGIQVDKFKMKFQLYFGIRCERIARLCLLVYDLFVNSCFVVGALDDLRVRTLFYTRALN